MTTKAAAPPSGAPSSSPQPSAPPVVVLRSVKLPSAVVVEHPATAGSPAVVRVLHKDSDSERQRPGVHASTLKNLSSDLSELLVKNLSLKRNSDTFCAVEDPSAVLTGSEPGGDGHDSDGLGLIPRSKQPNRNSLCDTFSSVNKLIKLKRVSSDSSSISSYTKIYQSADVTTQQHSINPPPQAKFKRVEISVQELPCEAVAPRKGIIVNQFDQLASATHEGESVPLLVKRSSVREGREEEESAEESTREVEVVGGSKVPSCDTSVGVKFRRRIQHPASSLPPPPSLRSGRAVGSILESVQEERYKRRSLQWPLGLGAGGWDSEGVLEAVESTVIDEEVPPDEGVGEERRRKTHFRHSWNAPGYDLLLEEDRPVDSRKDFASIVHNLAGLRSALANGGSHESASLLEPHSPQFGGPRPLVVSGGGAGPGNVPQVNRRSPVGCHPSSPVVPSMATDGSHPVSLGAPVPRKRRLEAFLKSLVGRRPSKEPPPAPPPAPAVAPPQSAATNVPRLSSPEIKISKSPSEHNLVEMTRSRLNLSTTSLSSVHQKLWSVVPLLKKDVSCTSLAPPKSVPLLGSQPEGGLRKCETVLALTNSAQSVEPIKPRNRLRNCASVATCSRCSSLLSLAAAGSRYSLNLSNGGFVAVGGGTNSHAGGGPAAAGKHVDTLLRLTKTSSGTSSSSSSPSPSVSSCSSSSSSSSNSSSRVSVTSKAAMLATPPSPTIVTTASGAIPALTPTVKFTCKLCLGEYGAENLTRISQCGCSFCTECMTAYIEFEISEGAYEVSCPDAMCPAQGIITIGEITTLAAPSLVDKHHRYRLNREVELDKFRTWCPRAGCETICQVGQTQPTQSTPTQPTSNASSDRIVQLPASSSNLPSPCAVHCPTCREDFCSGCKKAWHPTMSCEENTRRLAADGQTDALGIPFDNDLIKCCPMCAVPIEKDEGCAQMMCKRCKHVFCWYCLASLDDDFLLRHYDKGPCKNKLGHSRASVVWHRAQVIGIFAGFGILLLVASPLLLLAAPCIVCCKCRICSGAAKLEETEVDYDDAAVVLQTQR